MDGRPLIAIFCNSFPPEGGAASNRMFRLARLLRDSGYRVEVVTSMPNYPHGRILAGYRRAFSRRESVDGIPVQRCWIYPSNSRRILPRAVNQLSQSLSFRSLAFRRIRGLNPALVIASSPPLPMASAVTGYFHASGIPVLLNVSDLWPLSAKILGASGESALYSYLQKLEHRMYRDATAFSAQSQEIIDHIAASLQVPKRNFLLRNLPDRQPPASPQVVKSAPELRIIYPGLLGHAQGLLPLISSLDWATLPASLDIFGAGAQTAAIRSWLGANPGVPVRIHDPVAEAELRSLLPRFSAMLIPLVEDIPGAVPSKLFTAIHAGLPILYSAGGEGAEIVRTRNLGMVSAPGDYAALSRSILQLSSASESELAGIRVSLRKAATSDFDPAVQDLRFISFIRELTS